MVGSGSHNQILAFLQPDTSARIWGKSQNTNARSKPGEAGQNIDIRCKIVTPN